MQIFDTATNKNLFVEIHRQDIQVVISSMGAYETYGMVCSISNMPFAMQHEHTHILQKRGHAARVSTQ